MIKILFLAANPKNTNRLRLGEEIREIRHFICKTRNESQFEIIEAWAVKLSELQTHLSEMRTLFREHGKTKSMSEMVEWFNEKQISAVITMDKFGAICTYKGGKSVIIAWPFELDNIVDTTGAGDAFGAALVSKLYLESDYSFPDFLKAVTEARIWSAYACTKLGGSADCPKKTQLNAFHDEQSFSNPENYDPEVKDIRVTKEILRILDKAY